VADQVTEKNSAHYTMIPGIGMIILGALFLLANFDIIDFGHRWWALFFLIPISYMTADLIHRRKSGDQGRSRQSRGSLIGVVSLSMLMVIFLFDMRWSIVWPVFIIIGGISIILSQRR
jgi:hypothetical protein